MKRTPPPSGSPSNSDLDGIDERVVPPQGFPLLEGAALAGTASGVALGALAGPPGAIVGGAIGAAVGLMAGSTLEVESAQARQHERELDDTIGVTGGDLGARESAVAGLEGHRPELVAPGGGLASAGALLRAEHVRLEGLYDSLLAAYRQGDWPDVQATWQVFEPALRAHMELEERLVFPAFRATSPANASALLTEHAELRTLLETLAIHIELHAVPLADAEELIRRLRAHGHHEELVLYPWVEAAMDAAALAGPRT